ncbi:hypothetical protein [Planktotalea sp.]|uniref:hypothetical protein n=1 Tax=Planktotalea sp. TaxID=2029877 RepID=UPI003F6B3CB2
MTIFAVALLSAGVCFYAYYTFYFARRGCFNALGRCFDEDTGVVYLEQSGIAWLSIAAVFSAIAAWQVWRWKR